MKFLSLISLAPVVGAFVVPDQQVFQEIASKGSDKHPDISHEASSFFGGVKANLDDLFHGLKDKAGSAKHQAGSILDDALQFTSTAGKSLVDEAFDAHSWIEGNLDHLYDAEESGLFEEDKSWSAKDHDHGDHPPKEPPHHPPPEHPPHHRPHRPPHHGPGHKSNLTIYQLITESKYTTKLAKLLDDYPDLVDTLNSTKANHTIFVPIDAAFDKIPEHAPKPSKEQLKKLLSYHVSPGFYPAFRVLTTHTIPTLLETDELADKTVPQRLSVNIGLRGLTINFYSRVVGANLFARNGVIHAVDSLILPPPDILKIIELLPSEFSTLELALTKTGLLEDLDQPHRGGTFFAPSNFAFAKLGPRINAFLFSKYGQKYLKALLKYHVVPKTTLYSDHIYTNESDDNDKGKAAKPPHRVPKGYFHLELPTLLEDKSLSVDIARYGGFISIKLNGFVRVVVQDGVAKDGVIQVVGDVLIPPKQLPGSMAEDCHRVEGEMSLDEFKSRLEPYF